MLLKECRAFEGPDVGVNILRFLVGKRGRAEIGHGRRRNNRRDVGAAAQEGDEFLLGCQVAPASDEGARAGFTVVAVACVAAVGVEQLLSTYGIPIHRAGGRC